MNSSRRSRLSFAFLCVCILPAICARAEDRDRERLECPKASSGFREIEKRAHADDPAAQTLLASCYELGRHVKPDRQENILWLTRGATRGYAPAQYELGRIYLYGRGVSPDYRQALEWEMKAAQQGHPGAQRDVAYMYERGLGFEASDSEAAKWNRKAAEQGEPQAELHLAESLEGSRPLEAMDWYRRAARHNVPQAQLRLAEILLQDPARNCAEAVRWYEHAAENGLERAMYELGRLHESVACGGPRIREAYRWFQTGARFGSQECRADAEEVSAQLPEGRRKALDAQVERWIKKHPGSDRSEKD